MVKVVRNSRTAIVTKAAIMTANSTAWVSKTLFRCLHLGKSLKIRRLV